MAHVLARIEGVKPEDIKAILARDAADHAKEGLHLEHLWRDLDGPEVFFLFRTDDLEHARRFIDSVHGEAQEKDPGANLPEMRFFENV